MYVMAARRNWFDEQMIKRFSEALSRNAGNVRAAARELAIPERTAHEWIAKFKLRPLVERARKTRAA